jgi:hypothetical protein
MDVNDNACFLNTRVALESIASKLRSYGGIAGFRHYFCAAAA